MKVVFQALIQNTKPKTDGVSGGEQNSNGEGGQDWTCGDLRSLKVVEAPYTPETSDSIALRNLMGTGLSGGPRVSEGAEL